MKELRKRDLILISKAAYEKAWELFPKETNTQSDKRHLFLKAANFVLEEIEELLSKSNPDLNTEDKNLFKI